MKWLIETSPNRFQQAQGTMTVHPSGALIIQPSISVEPSLVLAPGQWISVVPDEDGSK